MGLDTDDLEKCHDLNCESVAEYEIEELNMPTKYCPKHLMERIERWMKAGGWSEITIRG